MRIVLDVDGTICSVTKQGEYEKAEPFVDVISKVNKLHDEGHYIIYFTARGMGANDGAVTKAYNQWYTITEGQLKAWGAKYNELMLGKPHGDVYIDDKAVSVNNDGIYSAELIDMCMKRGL